MSVAVQLTIHRANGDRDVRSYEHDTAREALAYARRVVADAVRWGTGCTYDVVVGRFQWRVFGRGVGCGGRPEVMYREPGRDWTWPR
jgi:hypothetical protein